MKKRFVRVISCLLAVIMIFVQLPLSSLITANADIIIPQEYPAKLVAELADNIDYISDNASSEDTETEFFVPINLTYDEYDCIEFDSYISPFAAFLGEVTIGIYDNNGNISTYSYAALQNEWEHISISKNQLINDSINPENVIGIKIMNPTTQVRYIIANLCLTGLALPAEITQGDVEYLIERIDVTDNNTSSAQSDVFDFGDTDTINLNSKDWVEFDIFVTEKSEKPVSVTPSIAFVDSDFSSSSKFGNDTATYKLSITTEKWNHIKIPTGDFTLKKCTIEEIVGIMITGMVNDYRYVIGNLSLVTANPSSVTAPEGAEIIADGIFINHYNTEDDYTLNIAKFDDVLDASKYDHLRLYIYADSIANETKSVVLSITDSNLKTVHENLSLEIGEWTEVLVPINYMNSFSKFLSSQIKEINISDLSSETRYFISTLSLTKVGGIEQIIDESFIYTGEYSSNTESYAFESLISDDFTNFSYDDVIDLTKGDRIEFDIFLDSAFSERPDWEKHNVSLYFCDSSYTKDMDSKGFAYHDLTLRANQWNHISIYIDDFVVIPVVKFDASQVRRYFILGFTKGVFYTIANMQIVNDEPHNDPSYGSEIAPVPEYEHNIVKTYDVNLEGKRSNITDERYFNWTDYQVGLYNLMYQPFEISDSQFIEFDIFSDVATTFDVSLGSLSTTPNPTYGNYFQFYDIRSNKKSITLNAGWNHIVLNTDGNFKEQDPTTTTAGTYNNKAVNGIILHNRESSYIRLTNFAVTTSVPIPPTIEKIDGNTVTLTAIDGLEYSRDGETWQDSNIFYNVPTDITVNFYQRKITIETDNSSSISKPLLVFIVSTPKAVLGSTMLRIEPRNGFEYCIDDLVLQENNQKIWQDSNEFEGLLQNSTYIIYCRPKNLEGVHIQISGKIVQTNGSDEILNPNSTDLVWLRRELFTFNESNNLAADFNKDCEVNMLDLICIKNILLNN